MFYDPDSQSSHAGGQKRKYFNSSPRPGGHRRNQGQRRGQLGEDVRRRMNGGVGEEEIRNMEDGVEDDKEVRDREHQQKQRHHGFINSGGLKTGRKKLKLKSFNTFLCRHCLGTSDTNISQVCISSMKALF